MKPKQKLKPLITFTTLYLEVLGPRELSNSRAANKNVKDFLEAAEQSIRGLLRERATKFPHLKRFKLKFD